MLQNSIANQDGITIRSTNLSFCQRPGRSQRDTTLEVRQTGPRKCNSFAEKSKSRGPTYLRKMHLQLPRKLGRQTRRQTRNNFEARKCSIVPVTKLFFGRWWLPRYSFWLFSLVCYPPRGLRYIKMNEDKETKKSCSYIYPSAFSHRVKLETRNPRLAAESEDICRSSPNPKNSNSKSLHSD